MVKVKKTGPLLKQTFLFQWMSIGVCLSLLLGGSPAWAQKAQITGSVGLTVVSVDETANISIAKDSKGARVRVGLEQTDYHLVYTRESADPADQGTVLVTLMY